MTSHHQWLGLEGKTCVVTGAGRGIGAAIARSFAEAGAAVALLDRDLDTLGETLSEIERAGGKSLAVVADIADVASVADAAARVKAELGNAKVLVNNAATILAGAILDVDLASFERLMQVNVTGTLICSQIFGKQMLEIGGGNMVHIGSLSGAFPQPFSGSYSVSKAGVSMLSSLLALELGEHGIRSNVVSPGSIRTPLSAGLFKDPDIVERRRNMIPGRRFGEPQDIADVVLFLSSDRSSYMTGQVVTVDGGLNRALMGLMPRPGFEKA